ncbi:MAG: hypothetical protein ACI90V_006287, partial [Bacillariaceae sp.]
TMTATITITAARVVGHVVILIHKNRRNNVGYVISKWEKNQCIANFATNVSITLIIIACVSTSLE